MEKLTAVNSNGAGIASKNGSIEDAAAEGMYTVRHFRNGALLSEEVFKNVVCTEGKNAMLDNTFSGSSYSAVNYMGLISSVSWSAVAAGDTMAQIAGTNGWKEAGTDNAPTFTARLAPSFAAASAGSKGQTATTNFTMTGSGTVKGCFLAIKSSAGVAPTASIGNTAGALWSAGTFSADKVVAASDIIQVTYSTSL